MDEHKKLDVVWTVEAYKGRRSQMLSGLRIPRSTYYKWRKAYRQRGLQGLIKTPAARKRIWNRMTPAERDKIMEVARLHPELSSRLLAVTITDEEDFTVSESTVYRVLKDNNLIAPRPFVEMPAEKRWRHTTSRPDELWQCDATNLFVVGWGYYKLIPVQDDYSRKILAYDVRPDETAYSLTDIVECALEHATGEGHMVAEQNMPKLYTDNAAGFTSKLMAQYLRGHGIRHIFGTPYHPQGRGKIERFNRRIKEKLCLIVYCSPGELKRAVDEAVAVYNSTAHEALDNVSPNDVYAGRKEVILERRRQKKRLTLERRRQYNLHSTNNGPNQCHGAN